MACCALNNSVTKQKKCHNLINDDVVKSQHITVLIYFTNLHGFVLCFSPCHAAVEGFQSETSPAQSGRCGGRACSPWWLDPKRAGAAAVTSPQGACAGRGLHQTPRRVDLGGPLPPSPCLHRHLLLSGSRLNTPPRAGEIAAVGKQNPGKMRPMYRRPQPMGSLWACAPICEGLCHAPPVFHVVLHALAAVVHSSLSYLNKAEEHQESKPTIYMISSAILKESHKVWRSTPHCPVAFTSRAALTLHYNYGASDNMC